MQILLKYLPHKIRHKAVIQTCLLNEIPFAELLPLDSSLANAKFRAVSGLHPKSMEEVCETLCYKIYSDVKPASVGKFLRKIVMSDAQE